MDIRTISDHDLLSTLEDRPVPALSLLDKWLISEQYYPGNTKALSLTLYQQYRGWCHTYKLQNPGNTQEIVHQSTWGVRMGMKFKKGRGASGVFYYTSRIPDSEFLQNIPGISE